MPNYKRDEMDPLTAFISNALGTTEGALHPSDVRERERQNTLKREAMLAEEWRDWMEDKAPVESLTGAQLRATREACDLSVADLSRITGATPQDIVAAEEGKTTYADAKFRHFAGAAVVALSQGNE